MTGTRTLVIASIVMGAVAASFWFLAPQPIPVETALVERGRFTAVVEEDGRTRVRDRFVVSAPVNGLLARITLRPGDNVRAGEQIAIIRPPLSALLDPRTRRELEERIGAAEAAVGEALAAKERALELEKKASTDYERSRRLRESGNVSAAQFDRDAFAFKTAGRELAMADRRLHAAEHTLAEVRSAVARYAESDASYAQRVTTPTTGVVLKVHQESEASVIAGAPLLDIGDPSDLEAIVDLLTTDAVNVRPGAAAEIRNWGGPVPLAARVRHVEPSAFTKVSALGVEEQRVWVVLDIISPREERTSLGDGFRVEVAAVIAEIDEATVAPSGALFRQGSDWMTFVVEDGRARTRAVAVERRSGGKAAVSTGVKPGERGILYAPSSIKDGVRVKVNLK